MKHHARIVHDLKACDAALQDQTQRERPEPDGFCVWCSQPYFAGKGVVHPFTREVHCSQDCIEEHDASV